MWSVHFAVLTLHYFVLFLKAQVVLQGKSRAAIIRELQRTVGF